MSDPEKKVDKISSEVSERAIRRRFTLDYQQRILAQADLCDSPGQVGELLRREGESKGVRVCRDKTGLE